MRGDARLKRAKRLAEDVLDLADDEKAWEHLTSSISGVAEEKYETRRGQVELGILSDYVEDAQFILDHWGQMMGHSSGYTSVDLLTKGFVDGEMSIVGAETSVGKTTFMCNLAVNMARQGLTVLFVSLETDKPNLTAKIAKIAGSDFEKIAPFIAVNKSDELNWQSVDKLVEKAVGEMGVSAIFIDHLHYFSRELDKVAEDLGRITKEMKKNAIRHKIPIILASHVRKLEGKKKADINDLRGSSYIAQDADVVLMLARSKEKPGNILVTCSKNRNRGIDFENNYCYLKFDGTVLSEGGQ